MTKRLMHFTLGPVQGFIADARRLRDYWAGSFILSLLAGHAMAAADDAKAEILFPQVDGDPLFEAIRNRDATADVYIGSLPNRFKAAVSACGEDIAGKCEKAIDDAWRDIHETIWDKYVKAAAARFHGTELSEDNPTKAVWDRQTNGFWEMAWAIGDEPADRGDGVWLDTRKNWRRLDPERVEAGDLCRVMGNWQELSGVERFSDDARDRQRKFWNAVRETADVSELDLPHGEYLCALALIKRLFPVHLQLTGGAETGEGGAGFPVAIPWKPGGGAVNIRHWPSTSYIAALPWLKLVAKARLTNDQQSALYLKAKEVFEDKAVLKSGVTPDPQKIMGETATALFALPPNGLFKLDGHLLHDIGIIAAVKERFVDEKSAEAENARSELTKALTAIAQAISDKPKGVYASGFYAVLRMDGDGIGKLLREHEKEIRKGLAKFTAEVKNYFNPDKGNPKLGALVYAGGDDVLAILPVDTAIAAARDIRDLYGKAFEDACDGDQEKAAKFTLSAGIVFAHFKSPLTAALRLSTEVLDEIAKKKNGRNSIAICIAKPGGVAAEWVSVFGEEPRAKDDAALQIADAATHGLTGNKDTLLSGGFFHALRDRYLAIMPGEIEAKRGKITTDALLQDGGGLLKALIGADLRRQFGVNVYKDIGDAKAVEAVFRILRPNRRDKGGNPKPQKYVTFDGGLIVRFLAMERRPPERAGDDATSGAGHG